MKIKKDVYVKMEEGDDDYGQFCVLDEEPFEIKWKDKPVVDVKNSADYGFFEKTLYLVSAAALVIVIISYV
jgi:hypothetical protein